MKVYVSCPIVVSKITLDTILKNLNSDKNITASAYIRGEKYMLTKLEESDAIVIIHPDNKFNFNLHTLPSGVLKEFHLAKAFSKEIFLCYFPKSENNVPYFYSIDYNENSNTITGIAGTSGSLFSMAEDLYAKQDSKNIDNKPVFSELSHLQKSLPLLIR